MRNGMARLCVSLFLQWIHINRVYYGHQTTTICLMHLFHMHNGRGRIYWIRNTSESSMEKFCALSVLGEATFLLFSLKLSSVYFLNSLVWILRKCSFLSNIVCHGLKIWKRKIRCIPINRPRKLIFLRMYITYTLHTTHSHYSEILLPPILHIFITIMIIFENDTQRAQKFYFSAYFQAKWNFSP